MTTNPGQPVSLSISAPSDADGDPLTITAISVPNPASGVVVKPNQKNVEANSRLTSSELTQLTFYPVGTVTGFVGSFSYSVSDGRGGETDSTISLEVGSTSPSTPTLNPPVAVNDGAFVTNINNPQPLLMDVLANDLLGDGIAPLIISNIESSSLGTVKINSPSQLVSFQPGSIRGITTFKYTIQDSQIPPLPNSTASINIEIIPADDDANLLAGAGWGDNLNGFDGDDTISGNEGNDTLKGDGGNDTLKGGFGADLLSGGSGQDRFQYTIPGDGGVSFNADSDGSINRAIAVNDYDVITDFVGLGAPSSEQFSFAPSFPNVNNSSQVLLPMQINVSGNILGGNKFVFAYQTGNNTYLIYDQNGDNSSGNDSRILAKLEGISGVSALDPNDFTFL